MRKTFFKKLTAEEIRNWEQKKEKEWQKNADFWIKIIREKLDPFRLMVTNRATIETVGREKKLRILDAGCGEGYLARFLAEAGHRVWGIDFCLKLIQAAKDLERKKSLGITYFVGDIRKTRFPNSYFDVVLSHQAINEIKNPGKAFKEFSRILKRKGKLICLFLHPCFEIDPLKIKKMSFSATYFQKTKIKKEYYLVGGIISPSPYFYLHLPLSEWIELLSKSGFLISKIKEPHPPLKFLKKNRWWKENFEKPFFILIEAIKK